jgi:hypothetical protein
MMAETGRQLDFDSSLAAALHQLVVALLLAAEIELGS